MKNGILRAMLLGVVASASFSLTQAASLAATASYSSPTTATNICAANPAKAALKNAAATETDQESTGIDRFMLLGGS